MPQLSVILPFHKESSGVKNFLQRLYPAIGKLNISYEIICVDDGSSDETFAALLHERQFDRRLKIVRFTRNFGKDQAFACGLQLAKGNVAITIDTDLSHPPELIPDLVKKWREGHDVVYATSFDRDNDTRLGRWGARALDAIFRLAGDVKITQGAGDYLLLDRKALDAINALPEKNRLMKGLTAWVGFRQASIPFGPIPREDHNPNTNLWRHIRAAFDGLSSFDTRALRLWVWCGALVSVLALAYGSFLIAATLISGTSISGHASLMVGILFFGGLQLLGLGIIGAYIARIFIEVKSRPLYLVSEKVGFE